MKRLALPCLCILVGVCITKCETKRTINVNARSIRRGGVAFSIITQCRSVFKLLCLRVIPNCIKSTWRGKRSVATNNHRMRKNNLPRMSYRRRKPQRKTRVRANCSTCRACMHRWMI